MKQYNTAIIPLGGIPDIKIIFETITRYRRINDIHALKNEFVRKNIFGFTTISSRKRFFTAISKLYLKGDNEDKQLFWELISRDNLPISIKKTALYVETCRSNGLIRDITIHLVYQKYIENRRLITSKEVYDFLTEFGKDTDIMEWSYKTIKTISSKYISFMKKLDNFEKKEYHKSMFSFSYPSKELVTYLVYLLKYAGYPDREIYQSILFNCLMIDETEKLSLIKQGAISGFYDFALSGSNTVDITLSFSKERMLDELFKR